MKKITFAFVFCALGAVLAAQSADTSGTGMLQGTFNFRLLQASNFDDNTGDITQATAVYGTITFDGNGGYTAAGMTVDNTVSNGAPQALSVTNGSYSLGGNGLGIINSPLDPTNSNSSGADNRIRGGYAQGIFVGSSTEGYVTSNFIAIPVGPVLTNSTFTGSYWTGLIDFPSGGSALLKNALFELSPNGQGTFGTIQASGQAENSSDPTVNQTITGATYTFGSGGLVNATFPLPSGVTSTNALIESGAKVLYVSADGNFLLGYTPSGYDLFFGVKSTGAISNSQYSGTYYISALEDGPDLGNPVGDVDGFYGSISADGQGDEIVHERLFSPFYYTIDYELDDYTTYTSANNGAASDINGYIYGFADNGNAFVGIGTGGFFSLVAGVHSNTFTGTGVFLNPVGVTNAASYAPITASLAPGELVTLVGSGLANSTPPATQGGQAFPPQIAGVSVTVNGTPAPLYYVSPTQISAILPYEIASSEYATIQVNNNGTLSNSVTGYVSDAMPGVFSQTANGIGYAAAVDLRTGQVVSQANQALAGDYLAVFLTGLGTVSPTISDGAVGPNPPAVANVYNSDNPLGVYFDDFNNELFEPGNLTFAGLPVGLAGLYQMNIQVPTGVGPGDVYLEVYTDYSDVLQIQIPIGSSGASTSVAAPHQRTGTGIVARHRPMAPRERARKLGRRMPADNLPR